MHAPGEHELQKERRLDWIEPEVRQILKPVSIDLKIVTGPEKQHRRMSFLTYRRWAQLSHLATVVSNGALDLYGSWAARAALSS